MDAPNWDLKLLSKPNPDCSSTWVGIGIVCSTTLSLAFDSVRSDEPTNGHCFSLSEIVCSDFDTLVPLF